MNNQQFERLVHNLQDIMRCPHCSAKYGFEDIHYLGQLESMTFLHMRCSGCQTPVFASVALADNEGQILASEVTADNINFSPASSTPVADELEHLGFERKTVSPEEELELEMEAREVPVEALNPEDLMAALTPVSYDNVLDVHEYLENFEGDFEQLLHRTK